MLFPPDIELPPPIHDMGIRNLGDTLTLAIAWEPSQEILVVFDTGSPLSRILTRLYLEVCPAARSLCFDEVPPEEVFSAFDRMARGDLVILIQSTSFRLSTFRIRVELFRRGLKVVEHPHLARMTGPSIPLYLESLAYDPSRLRPLGNRLKLAVAAAKSGTVVSGNGSTLVCNGPFEPASLNVGDYSATKNVGGQFPIGEVFTEAKNLESVEGQMVVFAYADRNFTMVMPERPILLTIAKGQVVRSEDAPREFEEILEQIRHDEGGTVWLREWGFGLNKAFSPTRSVPDVGTFERMNGLHFSLGAKHQIYPKPGFRRKDGRHHVDIFIDAKSIVLGDRTVFRDGDWIDAPNDLHTGN
ncbi:MAG: hypothetical protein H6686_06375 [Fibrobacteria bacterium]|nr:hypothetical protein [Fibrobacteria bacterium]